MANLTHNHPNHHGSLRNIPDEDASGSASTVTMDTCNLMQANHSYAPCATSQENTRPYTPYKPPLRVSAIEQQLLSAGVTPESLKDQWGITLWSIRPKSGRVKIKVDATSLLNINELEHWFEVILGQPVSVAQRSISQCCESPCKGCLWGDPEKRAFWDTATKCGIDAHPPQ